MNAPPRCQCGCGVALTPEQVIVAASRGQTAKWASIECKRRAKRRQERAQATRRRTAAATATASEGAPSGENAVVSTLDAMLASLAQGVE